MLVDGLPPESLTKTAIRDDIDPYLLAELSTTSGEPHGWGPHTRTDEWLCRIGEAVERLTWTLIRVNDGKPPEPGPWRRPGVLSHHEIAARELAIAAPVIDQLEAERAARQARRRAAGLRAI